MKQAIALTLGLIAVPALLTLSASAEILKQGTPTNGYYWQLVTGTKGSRWLCRKAGVSQFKKHASCYTAGAKKP